MLTVRSEVKLCSFLPLTTLLWPPLETDLAVNPRMPQRRHFVPCMIRSHSWRDYLVQWRLKPDKSGVAVLICCSGCGQMDSIFACWKGIGKGRNLEITIELLFLRRVSWSFDNGGGLVSLVNRLHASLDADQLTPKAMAGWWGFWDSCSPPD